MIENMDMLYYLKMHWTRQLVKFNSCGMHHVHMHILIQWFKSIECYIGSHRKIKKTLYIISLIDFIIPDTRQLRQNLGCCRKPVPKVIKYAPSDTMNYSRGMFYGTASRFGEAGALDISSWLYGIRKFLMFAIVKTSVNWLSIASDNGLSPVRWRQAITWPNAGVLSIGPSAINFSEIKIQNLSFMKMHLKCR